MTNEMMTISETVSVTDNEVSNNKRMKMTNKNQDDIYGNNVNEVRERFSSGMGACYVQEDDINKVNSSSEALAKQLIMCAESDEQWKNEVQIVEETIPKVLVNTVKKHHKEDTTRIKVKKILHGIINGFDIQQSTKDQRRQQVFQALVQGELTEKAAFRLTTTNLKLKRSSDLKCNRKRESANCSKKVNQQQHGEQDERLQSGSLDRSSRCGSSRLFPTFRRDPRSERTSKGSQSSSTCQAERVTSREIPRLPGKTTPERTGTCREESEGGTRVVDELCEQIIGREMSTPTQDVKGNENLYVDGNMCPVDQSNLGISSDNIILDYQASCYNNDAYSKSPEISDGLPTTLVMVKGCWYSMKLDTCAGCSIASYNLRKFGETSKMTTSITHVEGVSGNKLPVRGIRKFKMRTVSGDILYVNMLLVEGIKEDFLLGTDFFEEREAIMDFENRLLVCKQIGKKRLEIPFECNHKDRIAKTMKCTVAQKSTIPSESRGHAELHIDCNSVTQVIFLPIANEHNGIMLAPTVTKVKDNKITIPVMNMTIQDVKLPNKEILGTWIPVEKDIELLECNNLLTPESLRAWLQTLKRSDKPLVGEDDVKMDNLNTEQQELLKKLLRCYPDLIERREGCPPLTQTGVEHVINTGDAAPIFQKRLRHAVSENETIKSHVDKMLKDGVIEEGCGPWGFPVVLVKKKDGETRFCIDYRALNDVTVKDVYPLPRIDETIESVGGARWFSTLDLKSGYWQLGMREQDKDKTAFVTRQGLFRFKRMPFGLCNAPGTFQRMMDCVLRGLLWVCCLVYLDDVIVYTRGSFEQHLVELAVVFERLSTAGLTLKLSKCEFGSKELEFLGHLLTPEGIKPLERIVKAVRDFPTPKDADEVRRFVHLAGYYRKFIPQFGTKMANITKLLRKSCEWEWNPLQQEAFDEMKKELTNSPLLVYPDFKKPFILVTDASTVGIGAALMQDHGNGMQPVAYASKVNNEAQAKYSITKLECLAMVWAIKMFRPYLYGRKFTAITDHAALRWLMKSTSLTGMLHRWALTLQEYDFDIQYRAGSTNVVADALSRAPVGDADIAISSEPKSWEKLLMQDDNENIKERVLRLKMVVQLTNDVIIKAQDESKLCAKLKQAGAYMGMSIGDENGLLCINTRDGKKVVLPPALWPIAFKECHGSIWSGHLRLPKTLERLKQSYWWPNMERTTQAWIVMCQECGSRKARAKQVIPPLRPLGIGFVCERWVLDIAGPFPITQEGNRYVIAAIDWVSKYTVGVSVPAKSSTHVAKLLLTEVIFKFGPFKTLICDNAPEFVSKTIDVLVDMLQAKQHTPIPYRPNFVGLIERFNRTWKDMVAMYISRDHNDWDHWLPMALYAYNSAVQTSTGFQPAQLMMGRKLPTPSELLRLPTIQIDNLDNYHRNLLANMRFNEQVARNMISRAQERQAQQYNKQVRNNYNFKEGILVWVHLPPRGQGTTKFKHQWRGPGEIITDVGYDNRRIKFLDDQHEVIAHISQLVPYHSRDYMKIMEEVVNDWCEERLLRENGNAEDGIAWIYDNESQELVQEGTHSLLQTPETAEEWNEMEIQIEHWARGNRVFKEVSRKYKRNNRTGRYEPWYEIEYFNNNGRKVRQWLNRMKYEELWKNDWNDRDQSRDQETKESNE